METITVGGNGDKDGDEDRDIAKDDLRYMHGRHSLRCALFPANDNIQRVGRLVRKFEEKHLEEIADEVPPVVPKHVA
ncbi:hypothetical protein QYF36_014333 [Acer negundo]|nr:hypothetical protein QYF36_014333 [Acer negundo]